MSQQGGGGCQSDISDDENLEQKVIQLQLEEMEQVGKLSLVDVEKYAEEINRDIMSFVQRGLENKGMCDEDIEQNDYEEEEVDCDDDDDEGMNMFLGDMEKELSSIMVSNNSPVKIPVQESSPSICTVRDGCHDVKPDETPGKNSNVRLLEVLSDIRESPTNKPLSSITKLSPSEAKHNILRNHAHPTMSPNPPMGTPKGFMDFASSSYNFLTTYCSDASSRMTTTINKHIEEVNNKIDEFDASEESIKSMKNKQYLCLLSCPTAVEITIPARSCTKLPFAVPTGKDISWRFLVKDFDIGFSVCLRERVYVLQGGGEGGAVENEIIPYFKLPAGEKIEEKCCAERVPRHFVFVLDNSYSTFRSKTLVYDISICDAAADDAENECIERFKHSYQNEKNTGETLSSDLHDQIPIEGCNNNQFKNYPISTEKNDDEFVDCDDGYHVEYGNLTDEDINNGWSIHYDENGYHYYHNYTSGISQWEHPSEDRGTSEFEAGEMFEREEVMDEICSQSTDGGNYDLDRSAHSFNVDLVPLSSIKQGSTQDKA